MKLKVIITGKTGYLSTSLSKYLSEKGVANETVSVRNSALLPDFVGATSVVHSAGIVHVKAHRNDYYKVNAELTLKLAKKAKADGVKQFIFLSTASVYNIGFSTVITSETRAKPMNDYAKSKLLAEKKLKALSSDSFKVAIVRLPMVYGSGCPGNFIKLYTFAKIVPFFPYVENCRTMLFIDNFTEFIRLLISDGGGGIFFPQNREYVNTSVLYSDIRRFMGKNGKNTVYLKRFGRLLVFLGKRLEHKYINKLFGSFTYDRAMSNHFGFKYCVSSYTDSIAKIAGLNLSGIK